jgi:magnesium-transporting ATPase (P-type)
MEERDVWVRVVRSGGVAQRVKSSQLVVGDVLVLETGDR